MEDLEMECPQCENGMLLQKKNDEAGVTVKILAKVGAYRNKGVVRCNSCDHKVESYVL